MNKRISFTNEEIVWIIECLERARDASDLNYAVTKLGKHELQRLIDKIVTREKE
jgi:hypothetical protein